MNEDRKFDPARQARITEVKNTKVTLHNARAIWEEIGELEQYAVSAATQRRLMSVRRRAGLLLAKHATHIWDCPKRTIEHAYCICRRIARVSSTFRFSNDVACQGCGARVATATCCESRAVDWRLA